MNTSLKRILVADDSNNDVELTLTALEDNNIVNQVDVVNDGTEALDYLYCRGKYVDRVKSNPAAILLDLKMPKINGIEVLEIIKTDNKLKMIPVIVLTSSKEDPDIERCYELGVNAYVVKPVDFTQFIGAVKQLGMFWGLINEPPPICK